MVSEEEYTALLTRVTRPSLPRTQQKQAVTLVAEKTSTCEETLEDIFYRQVQQASLPFPQREYRFAPPRRWRADFAWVQEKLLLEVEGGTWINGRHSTGAGFEKDCVKYGEAVALGWRVLRVTGGMVRDRRALALVKRLLAVPTY